MTTILDAVCMTIALTSSSCTDRSQVGLGGDTGEVTSGRSVLFRSEPAQPDTAPAAAPPPREQWPPGAVQAGPLLCLEPVHDFGVFRASDEPLRHSFTIWNLNNEEIRIKTVIPGFTSSTPYRAIPPGSSIEVPYSLKTSALNGRFEKSVTLEVVTPEEAPPADRNVTAPQAAPHDRAKVRRRSSTTRSSRSGEPLPSPPPSAPPGAVQGHGFTAWIADRPAVTDATSQSYPSGIQSGPLYCPSPVRDVGTIWAGDRLTTTYEVFNIGDTPVAVRITPVYTGTAAAHDPILIAPGRTLIIDVNRKSPDTLHGVFTTAYVVHVIDE